MTSIRIDDTSDGDGDFAEVSLDPHLGRDFVYFEIHTARGNGGLNLSVAELRAALDEIEAGA